MMKKDYFDVFVEAIIAYRNGYKGKGIRIDAIKPEKMELFRDSFNKAIEKHNYVKAEDWLYVARNIFRSEMFRCVKPPDNNGFTNEAMSVSKEEIDMMNENNESLKEISELINKAKENQNL
ncbi:hypothetical protein LVD15_12480 [Fulvivirga maritima]|uniref:hypothetical protein n=1 Tax=Fulvivirga maritima TaxID=2904247 RepID=UPI001F34852D|nr:hypothetical protein [Fulvivirga maritima]UII29202.1 hypothetical protein LVD15_12480 [Fulvivirga maritima]